jgi:hypothetical protein
MNPDPGGQLITLITDPILPGHFLAIKNYVD